MQLDVFQLARMGLLGQRIGTSKEDFVVQCPSDGLDNLSYSFGHGKSSLRKALIT